MAMNLRILACTQALLLALPPGWCCIAPQPAAAEQPLVATGYLDCCHQDSPTNDTPGPCSGRPIDLCCCHADMTIPASQLTMTGKAIFTVPVSLAGDTTTDQCAPRPLAVGLRPPGPSLQVLHCVWRC